MDNRLDKKLLTKDHKVGAWCFLESMYNHVSVDTGIIKFSIKC